MITYEKLWETMKKNHVSQYDLVKRYGVSGGQLDRLRKGANVNTKTLNHLCGILHCELKDIVEYVAE